MAKLIGERMREAREQQGTSQAEQARRLGIPKETLCRYESGRIQKVPHGILKRTVETTECDGHWLLGVAQ